MWQSQAHCFHVQGIQADDREDAQLVSQCHRQGEVEQCADGSAYVAIALGLQSGQVGGLCRQAVQT